MNKKDNYDALYRRIGYSFKNEELIAQALTHRSKQKKNNERLEFLGDSILSFIVAEILYSELPHLDEGSLSLLRIQLVCGKSLAKIGKDFYLGNYISCNTGGIKSSGYSQARLLEDTVEAIIGAIYLDSNITVTKTCILNWFKKEFSSLPSDSKELIKDSKSELQEYLQATIQTYPLYSIISTEGLDHDQTFTVEVSLGSKYHTYRAKGKTRKGAEQIAARKALEAVGWKKKITHEE